MRVARPSKYKNVKTTRIIDGQAVVLDSKAEAKFYDDLLIRHRKGEVCLITVHPVYEIAVHGKKIGKYVADFSFLEKRTIGKAESWQQVTVDVKGVQTAAFRLKWKLVKALYPHVEWRLVMVKPRGGRAKTGAGT